MTREPGPRAGAAPLTKWLVGCVGAVLGLAALAYVVVAVWFAYAVPAFFDRPQPSDEQVTLDKKAGLTRFRLQEALKDGKLTDAEITWAAGEERRMEEEGENHRPPRLVVKYAVPGKKDSFRCVAFAFPDGLKAGKRITSEQLDDCPF
ncbi:hypothetical protein AB0C52_08040 [Streptomyces sp. NPDC048717]|uniref:hypothetical protein n=1 Tax=Streptomyces sp. NPDC048717 TaxID=3154928 RepID=UPI0034285799